MKALVVGPFRAATESARTKGTSSRKKRGQRRGAKMERPESLLYRSSASAGRGETNSRDDDGPRNGEVKGR
jgi:hypothetical protein